MSKNFCKRIFSAVLALCIMAGLLPATLFAQTAEATGAEKTITENKSETAVTAQAVNSNLRELHSDTQTQPTAYGAQNALKS